MKKSTYKLSALMLSCFVFTSCEKDDDDSGSKYEFKGTITFETTSYDLTYGFQSDYCSVDDDENIWYYVGNIGYNKRW